MHRRHSVKRRHPEILVAGIYLLPLSQYRHWGQKTNQLDAGDLFPVVEMKFTEMAGSEHTNFKHGYLVESRKDMGFGGNPMCEVS